MKPARAYQVAARHGVCVSLVFCWRQRRLAVLVSPRAGFPTCADERAAPQTPFAGRNPADRISFEAAPFPWSIWCLS